MAIRVQFAAVLGQRQFSVRTESLSSYNAVLLCIVAAGGERAKKSSLSKFRCQQTSRFDGTFMAIRVQFAAVLGQRQYSVGLELLS
jgi:hypothetical protein